MANAIKEALNRASQEAKLRNQQVIDEARRNIKLVSMQQLDDVTPSGAETISRNAQIIEEARRNIPIETMQEVDNIGPPLNTPPTAPSNAKVVQINAHTQQSIESIEQGPGNNYLRETAMDRAMARSAQEQPLPEREQQVMSR